MELPRGITGFDVPGNVVLLDEPTFRRDCWDVVRPLGGRVLEGPLRFPGSPDSFHALGLEWQRSSATVLCNKFYRWVGFCDPVEPGQCVFRFRDIGGIGRRFAALGSYRVLSEDELERPITDEMCGLLRKSEIRQIHYCSKYFGLRTLRVGDVVFNFWD